MTVVVDHRGRIVTDRLLLRQWTDADRAPFAAMNADPCVRAHFPRLLTGTESDASVETQRRSIAATGFGFWAVERRSDGAFIGFTGLQRVDVGGAIADDVEIGWRLARAYWAMGYAAEAARVALDLAFTRLDLPRVVAMTVAGNTRSWGLMARLGMTRRAELDFDHPFVAPGHPLSRHIVYVIDADAAA